MITYQKLDDGGLSGNGWNHIPISHSLYKKALNQVESGEAEILPYVEPAAPIPQVVTMRQARLALLSTGRLADVETAISGMTEPDKTAATIEWEYSQTVERDRPFVTTLAGLLSLTETDLDDLFTLAATL